MVFTSSVSFSLVEGREPVPHGKQLHANWMTPTCLEATSWLRAPAMGKSISLALSPSSRGQS